MNIDNNKNYQKEKENKKEKVLRSYSPQLKSFNYTLSYFVSLSSAR